MTESKAYFDDVAHNWDTMRAEFFPESVRETALAVAGVRANQTAADIGAGTGFVSEALLAQGLRVIAVDQSREMLDVMHRKFASHAGFEGRLGQEGSLPIPSASMDHAFANMYLHHVEDPQGAIHEMVRILRSGGHLVITDLDEHDFDFLKVEQHDRWMGFKREEISRWFSQAGLQDVRVECVGENCCANSTTGDAAQVSIFVASGVRGPT